MIHRVCSHIDTRVPEFVNTSCSDLQQYIRYVVVSTRFRVVICKVRLDLFHVSQHLDLRDLVQTNHDLSDK